MPKSKLPIEGVGWVERELRRRSRSLTFKPVPEEHQTFIYAKKKNHPITIVVAWRDGGWQAQIENSQRRPPLDVTIVNLPRVREDRIRVLYAIAREYLTST